MLPVALTIPAVRILPPVTLALTDTVVPVCVVALTLAPPNTLPPVMLPVALINPPVSMLPPVTLPLADTTPVTNCPVLANVAIALPATLAVMLLLALTVTLLVPLVIAAPADAVIPVSCEPLPTK